MSELDCPYRNTEYTYRSKWLVERTRVYCSGCGLDSYYCKKCGFVKPTAHGYGCFRYNGMSDGKTIHIFNEHKCEDYMEDK